MPILQQSTVTILSTIDLMRLLQMQPEFFTRYGNIHDLELTLNVRGPS